MIKIKLVRLLIKYFVNSTIFSPSHFSLLFCCTIIKIQACWSAELSRFFNLTNKIIIKVCIVQEPGRLPPSPSSNMGGYGKIQSIHKKRVEHFSLIRGNLRGIHTFNLGAKKLLTSCIVRDAPSLPAKRNNCVKDKILSYPIFNHFIWHNPRLIAK